MTSVQRQGELSVDRLNNGVSDSNEPVLFNGKTFDVLSNDSHRRVLYSRSQTGCSGSKRELSWEVTALEGGKPVENVTVNNRKHVHIALQQTHRPGLEPTELIREGGTNEEIKLTGGAGKVEVNLDISKERQLSRCPFFLESGIGSYTLVTVGGLGIGPFGASPPILLAGLLALTYTFGNLIQMIQDQRNELWACGGRPQPTKE